MKKSKKLIIIFTPIVILLCIALIIPSNYLANYALDTKFNGGIGIASNTTNPEDLLTGSTEKVWLGEISQDIYIKSHDGLKLHAYLLKNETSYSNGNYMMIFHGYKGSAAGMASFAMNFYDMGYSILLPDARAHGLSEGRYIGMGWPERLDNLLWIEEILKIDNNAKIGLYGISMGGSTVINTAGEDLPKQVVVAVEDCGYSSAMEQFSSQMNSRFNLPSFPLLNVASIIAQIKSGVNIRAANCTKQAAKIKIPTLFIHGSADTFVPFEMLDKLYNAANCKKEKLVIENAGHGTSSSTDPVLYWSTVERFIKDAMK
ncbi:MAG: alpha/beta hydrolase [Ruminococcaceae bacterium]|nr:alpha/beta hydrolase [Oscillospiraceae bacterium]